MAADEYAYRDLVFGVQAVRRRVERDALALGGALGVAAKLLPHQVANVARILTDLEVRHLLADEVGLGKTVQALMVLNALRLERPGLRSAIIVPNELMTQWRDELRARGQQAPTDGDELDEDVRPVLLWPKILNDERVDLSAFDLLIVDELHQLSEALQREIANAAASIESLLILTATPPLRDAERMDRLMALIEPVRASAVPDGVAALDHLRDDERRVAALLEHGATDSRRPPSRRAAAAAHGTSRRILRTRRVHWKHNLPSRELRLHSVEPTANERERLRLMWRYFAHLGGMTREFELDLLAQRALRSPASLRQRVTYLKGHGHERDGILAQVQETLDSDRADSRFDALCDILIEIWAVEPAAKVVIAAGDNLTVDDLAARLPKLFDGAEPLRVATVRNLTEGAEALADAHEFGDAVKSFWDGSCRVLAAARVGSFGLNLQCARHLILYSLPWDPQETEQWIGRVDRIGNSAVDDGTGGYLPIVIHVPFRRGLIDERVTDVMRETGILERSLNLDKDAVHAARAAIEDAALRDDPAAWISAIERAKAIGQSQELDDLDLPLADALPGSPQEAIALHRRLAVDSAPVGPVADPAATGDEGRELALIGWLKCMRSADEYEVRWRDRSLGVRSLGYVGRALKVTLGQAARRPLDETLISHPKVPAYFRSGRLHLEYPPLTDVQPFDDDTRKPLYFLDHGSPLHEDLLRVWTPTDVTATRFGLVVPRGHPLDPVRGAVLFVAVARLDPTALLPDEPNVPRFATAADRRFLTAHLPPTLLMAGLALTSSGKTVPVGPEALRALLAPPPTYDTKQWSATTWKVGWLSEASQRQAEVVTSGAIFGQAEAAWGSPATAAAAALRDRCFALGAEMRHSEALAQRSLAAIDGARTASRQREIDEDLRAALEVGQARVRALEEALGDASRRALQPVMSAWIHLYA